MEQRVAAGAGTRPGPGYRKSITEIEGCRYMDAPEAALCSDTLLFR